MNVEYNQVETLLKSTGASCCTYAHMHVYSNVFFPCISVYLCIYSKPSSEELVLNVEYNQVETLLKSTGASCCTYVVMYIL